MFGFFTFTDTLGIGIWSGWPSLKYSGAKAILQYFFEREALTEDEDEEPAKH